MKKKAFLGAPFGDWMNPKTGRLCNDKENLLSEMISFLDKKGYHVENAHLREDWGRSWMPPDICTPLDYQQIKQADIFVAIPGNPASGGVHIELGWASALKKKTIILIEKNKNYSNLVHGLHKVGLVKFVRYSNDKELFEKLEEALNDWG